MHSLLKHATWKEILQTELLPFFISALIAEICFKFHSLTLECGAFLALWYVLGASYAAMFQKPAPTRGR